MKVSVIIPTLNEEHSIGKLLQEMPRNLVHEVIVLDGNSTDNTRKVAESFGCKVALQKGRGYGSAFMEAFPLASGDAVILMDADGSHDPKDILPILDKLNEGYEYVMASRFLRGGKSEDETWISYFGSKLLTSAANIVHGMNITDSLLLYTGIRREGLLKLDLRCTGFEFCPEIVIKAHKAGLRFAEVPTKERIRYGGSTNVKAVRDGLKILREILRLKFTRI